MSPGPLCVIAAAVLAALYLWVSGGRLIEAAQAEIGTDDGLMDLADAVQDEDVAFVRELGRNLFPAKRVDEQLALADFALWQLEWEA